MYAGCLRGKKMDNACAALFLRPVSRRFSGWGSRTGSTPLGINHKGYVSFGSTLTTVPVTS